MIGNPTEGLKLFCAADGAGRDAGRMIGNPTEGLKHVDCQSASITEPGPNDRQPD